MKAWRNGPGRSGDAWRAASASTEEQRATALPASVARRAAAPGPSGGPWGAMGAEWDKDGSGSASRSRRAAGQGDSSGGRLLDQRAIVRQHMSEVRQAALERLHEIL